MTAIGSLFSGIGGLDIGIERATGARLAWACEADGFPRSVLAARWPDAPLYEDVRGMKENRKPSWVDIICGGFPCQDVSLAGKGAGLAGARSGLWYEMIRIVAEMHPRVVVVENVGALVKRGLATVAQGLAELGYAVEWQTLTALAVGALHIRSRVFIVAHRLGRVGIFADPGIVAEAFAANRGSIWAREPVGVPRTVTRTEMAPSVRRARLKALGNAVVPQVAEVVGRCIDDALERPQAPRGWRTLGVVTDGEGRTPPDLFGVSWALDMPSCGALVDGLLYETPPLCDLRTAKARHAATPGPFGAPSAAWLVPTFTASEYGSNQGGANPGPQQHSLGTMARRFMLPGGVAPTPRASDWRSGRTSAATAAKNSRPLCEVVVGAQGNNRGVRVHRRRRGPIHGGRVRMARGPKPAPSGHLNPAWVAWLMGFPAGWFEGT